jgi:hypothetical protein
MAKRIGCRRAATLGAVLALVGGCSGGGSSASGPTTTTTRPSRTVVLDGDPMENCRVASMDAYCGRLTVPEDRSDPGGRVIDLAIAVVPAEDQGIAPGAVFFLAGGPGGSATDSWAGAARAFPGVHASWDIVLVDQRGTGGSNQMLLPESPDLEDLSEAEIRELLPGWVDAAFAGLDGDPRFYTSTVAADDLDDVRAALGYEQINLYGGSYGATLAHTTCVSTRSTSASSSWTAGPCWTYLSGSSGLEAARARSRACWHDASHPPRATVPIRTSKGIWQPRCAI